MIRSLLAMIAIAVGATVVMAQSDPITQRKSLMKSNGQHASALNRMVRGEEPFDAAKVDAAFAAWADNATKIPTLFASPPPAGAETRALPKIWEQKNAFDAKTGEFGKAVADNKDKAKTLDELKVAFPRVNNVCNECHEDNRRPSAARGQKQ
jgi:cytochrome c556